MLRWLIKIILALLFGVSIAVLLCHLLSPMRYWIVLVAVLVFCFSGRILFRLCDEQETDR